MKNLRYVKSSSRFVLFYFLLLTILTFCGTFITGIILKDIEMSDVLYDLIFYSMSLICTIISIYYGYLIFFKQYNIKVNDLFKLKEKNIFKIFYDVISMLFIILICNIPVGLFLDLIHPEELVKNINYNVVTIVLTCVLAPIYEELMFRGLILKTLSKYNAFIAVVISSVLFGLFHFSIYQFLSTIILGACCGYLAIKYKSIVPGILLHMFNNVLATLPDIHIHYESIILIIVVALVIIYILRNIDLYNFGKKVKRKFNDLKTCIILSFSSLSFIIIVILNIIIFIKELLGKTTGLYS